MTHKSFFVLLICAMLVCPALAAPYPTGSYTDAETITLAGVSNSHYNVTSGNAIGGIVFTTPIETNVTFTLYYGSSETITGEIDYVSVGSTLLGNEYSINSYSRVAIGTNESSNAYWDIGGGVINRYGITGHARDDVAGTSGIGVWDTSVLNFYSADNIAYVAIPNIGTKPIYAIDIQANRPVDVDISVGETSYIQGQSAKSPGDILNEWLTLAMEIGSFIYGVVTSALSWTLFIWENLGLIIALYIALTGYMAFQKGKKNVLRSIQIFFGYQKSLFQFLMSLPQYIVDLIEKMRNIFRLI